MRPFSLLAGLLILVAATSTARASIMYTYLATDASGNDINGKNLTIAVGSSKTIYFYLVETLSALNKGGGKQQSLIALEGGVKSVGVGLVRQAAGSADATVTFANNPLFNQSSITNITGTGGQGKNRASLGSAVIPGTPLVTYASAGSSFDGAVGKIFIGTATIKAVSLGANTFDLQVRAPGGSWNVTGTNSFGLEYSAAAGTTPPGALKPLPVGYDYTGLRATLSNLKSPVQFTVNSPPAIETPEPTTMVLGVLGAVGMGVGAYRRRRSVQVIPFVRSVT